MKSTSKDLSVLQDIDKDTIKDKAEDLLSKFDAIDNTALQSLSSEYLKFSPNSSYSFIFDGFTTFTDEDGEAVKAARLIDKAGKQWINAATVLVGSLDKTTDIPCLVKIVTSTEKKSGNGKYMQMEVFVIPQKTIKS
jgi:hypothetical protein